MSKMVEGMIRVDVIGVLRNYRDRIRVEEPGSKTIQEFLGNIMGRLTLDATIGQGYYTTAEPNQVVVVPPQFGLDGPHGLNDTFETCITCRASYDAGGIE